MSRLQHLSEHAARNAGGARASRPRVAFALLIVVAAAPGCIIDPEPDQDRVVMGRVDGNAATNQYFKVFLVDDEGYATTANFDRRDWYVTGIERSVNEKRVRDATLQGIDRGLLNEVIVTTALAPGELNEYRFDSMEEAATARGESFDRAALDAEWDARLREIAEAGAPGPSPLPVVPEAPALPTAESG